MYIPKGSGFATIAGILDEAEIVRHPLLFRLVDRIFFGSNTLKAGEYQFDPGISPIEVLGKLHQGDVFYRRITLPEGLTTAEIRTIIDQTEGLSGKIPDTIKEGSLYPDTYYFSYNDTKSVLIERMQQAQKVQLEELMARYGAPEGVVTTTDQVIILASIIEEETGVDGERGQIAGVFLNRLKQGMRLQSDPTVIYAITQGKSTLGRPLTKQDLNTDSLFNTYRHAGLPPAPICNPGRAAMEAVFKPTSTHALYFVADGKGGHRFAQTLQEHNRNVRQYRNYIRTLSK